MPPAPGASSLHLICGIPCAGKTTYAEKLRDDLDAVHLSLDRWLITSFGRYPVAIIGHDEHLRRVYACRELIWDMAAEFLRRGVDAILDDGFFLRNDRRDYIARAKQIGAGTTTHFIDTPPKVATERVMARNQQPGDYSFEIAPDALEGYIAFFEPPSREEGAELVIQQTTRADGT